jgi:hypothetical protein
MNRLLMLGIFVLAIGISATVLAFHFLPSGDDGITGAAVGETDNENVAEDVQEQSAEPQETQTSGYPDQIQEGMTMDAVRELAGEPLEKQAVTSIKGNIVEYWYYQNGEDVWQIAFSDSIVTAVRKY